MGFLVLGRGPANGVVLDHPSVAFVHATVTVDARQGVSITDCGTETGTHVNGATTGEAPRTLAAGDELSIGPFVFRVAVAGSSPPSEMPGPRVATLSGKGDQRILTVAPPAVMPTGERGTVALLEADPGGEVFVDGVQLGDLGALLVLGRGDATSIGDIAKIERKITREVARKNGTPRALLSALNKALATHDLAASVTCLRFDHSSRRLAYAVAGDPAPWLVRDGRASRLPDVAATVELGRIPLASFAEQTVALGTGEVALAVSLELEPFMASSPDLGLGEPGRYVSKIKHALDRARATVGGGAAAILVGSPE